MPRLPRLVLSPSCEAVIFSRHSRPHKHKGSFGRSRAVAADQTPVLPQKPRQLERSTWRLLKKMHESPVWNHNMWRKRWERARITVNLRPSWSNNMMQHWFPFDRTLTNNCPSIAMILQILISMLPEMNVKVRCTARTWPFSVSSSEGNSDVWYLFIIQIYHNIS